MGQLIDRLGVLTLDARARNEERSRLQQTRLLSLDAQIGEGEQTLLDGPRKFKITMPAETTFMDRIVGVATTAEAVNAIEKYQKHFGIRGTNEVDKQPIAEEVAEDFELPEIQRKHIEKGEAAAKALAELELASV